MHSVLQMIQENGNGISDSLISYIDIDTLITCAEEYPRILEILKANNDGLFNIITLYTQNNKPFHSNQEFEPKTFQYIWDYNGAIKVIAKKSPPCIYEGGKRNTENFKSYDRKLYNSISRARQTIFDLAFCNDWEYFVTFTISKQYYDRYDLDTFMKAFRKWLSNYSARKIEGGKLAYVLVPEWGRKFAWHLHGFMSGIPLEHLSQFMQKKQPRLFRDGYLNWKAYENNFGHCAIGTPIRSIEKVAAYITKQLRKPWMAQKRPLHSQLYYCTRNLKRPTEVCRGHNLVDIDNYDYEDDNTASKWFEK